MNAELTQEYLRSILKYNLLTGIFCWKVDKSNNAKKGSLANCIANNKGKKYVVIRIDGKNYFAHRLAFLYVLSAFPKNGTDHINGNGTDNRWINLRHATDIENSRNRRTPIDNTSGHIGVCWHKRDRKWTAKINVNKVTINLGYFSNINDAIKSRKKAEIKYCFHKNHGQVRPL